MLICVSSSDHSLSLFWPTFWHWHWFSHQTAWLGVLCCVVKWVCLVACWSQRGHWCWIPHRQILDAELVTNDFTPLNGICWNTVFWTKVKDQPNRSNSVIWGLGPLCCGSFVLLIFMTDGEKLVESGSLLISKYAHDCQIRTKAA